MLRQPAVAGYFYSQDRYKLEQEIREYLPQRSKIRAIAIIVPHAGYKYSGHVAGEVYASVELPDTFIILCPNHTGDGADFDLYPDGEWLTPLGAAHIDSTLSDKLHHRFPRVTREGRAHAREHSLEVQIPFLQMLKGPRFTFVALSVGQFRYDYLEELGHAIAEVIQSEQREVLIIASSDMTHYEKQESAEAKDRLAIQHIERLDPRGLYDTVNRENISMCGILPVTSALVASQRLGAIKGKVLKYATSGDVSGDYKSVVGYAGVVIQKPFKNGELP